MTNRWGTIALGMIFVVAGVAGCGKGQQAGKPKGFPPSVIAATTVSEAQWTPELDSVGSLVANNGIDVSTEVSGIVSKIVFNSGQHVEQGQELIRLDDAVDVAALEALRAESRLMKVKFNRASGLLKKRVLSQSEYDEAKASYDAAKARVKEQEAIINRKVIRAPFSGLLGIRQVDLGQYIKDGGPIVSLQAVDPIYVDYNLPERYLTRIKPGQEVNIKLDALPGQTFSGKVTAVNSGVDTGTRTLKIRAELKNPDGVLRPGMFAEVKTIVGAPETVLTLPRTAISFNTYGSFVFVINKNAGGLPTVKRTPVQTSESRNGRVKISGLSADTEVVRTGLVKLRDGMPVKIDNHIKLDDKEIDGE
jgi:membrane fusion protein (multidrug efflux system)